MYFLLSLLIGTAHAVRLENAGTWTVDGSINAAVASMWVKICMTLPFCTVGANAPAFLAMKLIRFISSLILGVGVLVMIYAGIKVTLSEGSDESVTEAKKIGMWAASGIGLSILARVVVEYVGNVFLREALQ